MLWVVLATMASSLPQAKVASTYDEAACAEAERARAEEGLFADDAADVNCSEPPPPVPAALDCNDARVGVWLGEMIGSCDMPRSQGAVVRAGSSEQRICRDGHCGLEPVPVRAATRALDDLTPILSSSAWVPFGLTSQPTDFSLTLRASQRGADRLERPPRSI